MQEDPVMRKTNTCRRMEIQEDPISFIGRNGTHEISIRSRVGFVSYF